MKTDSDFGPCLLCGRPCPNPVWFVNYDNATDTILRPGEQTDNSGLQPVGSRCIGNIPKDRRVR